MPETSPDNLDHEQESASAEAIPTEQEQEPITRARQLREAVFTHAEPASTETERSGSTETEKSALTDTESGSSTETEVPVEPEPVSFWEKIKHSAVNGNKQKAAAPTADRSSRRQNKTGLLVGGVLTVFVAGVWLLYLVSSPVRKPPAQDTAASTQQLTAKNEKSLTPGLQAHPGEQQPSGDQAVTAADIRGTANGTTPRSPVSAKTNGGKNDQEHELGNIPPPPPPVSAPPAPPVSNQKNALDTTALVFVRHPLKEAAGSVTTSASFEPVSLRPAVALQSQQFADLPTGTRLIARLETPVTTAVTLPAVATVEYNYEDKDHELLIPAGSRVFGKLEQADGQGFVGLRFQSIQRPSDPAPIPFDARAIGLNFQPLKGVVTGRNTTRRFLVRAASGIGEMTAATVGMSRGSAGGADALNNNVLIREQLMNNVGSAGDQELQQLAYSERRVVTLAGNTRFYLVIDHEAKQRERQDQQQKQPAPDANATSASMQAQLVELRKELADVTAKQTSLGAGPTPPGTLNPAAGTLTPATETLNPVSSSEATNPADPPQ